MPRLVDLPLSKIAAVIKLRTARMPPRPQAGGRGQICFGFATESCWGPYLWRSCLKEAMHNRLITTTTPWHVELVDPAGPQSHD